MTEALKFPRAAAKYIGLQRLETQALGKGIHYTSIGKLAYKVYEFIPFSKHAYRFYSTNIEPRVRSGVIISEYSKSMAREFDTIREHLGVPLDTVIGIGPGMAGLEILMSRSQQAQGHRAPLLILVDKTGLDPIHFGFKDVAAVYNSLDMARDAVVANGHPADRVLTVEADTAEESLLSREGSVDLVTSLIAWGFHFPVDTYLAPVLRWLRPGGRLIIDVRKGTDGRGKLEQAFAHVEKIHDDPKFERLLAIK